MSTLVPIHAQDRLQHLAQQFAQWRQNRTTPRGRIPQSLWAQAVALSSVLPPTRVAKQLKLTPQARKGRREEARTAPVPLPSPPAPHFVEVTTAWHVPPRRGRSPTAGRRPPANHVS